MTIIDHFSRIEIWKIRIIGKFLWSPLALEGDTEWLSFKYIWQALVLDEWESFYWVKEHACDFDQMGYEMVSRNKWLKELEEPVVKKMGYSIF